MGLASLLAFPSFPFSILFFLKRNCLPVLPRLTLGLRDLLDSASQAANLPFSKLCMEILCVESLLGGHGCHSDTQAFSPLFFPPVVFLVPSKVAGVLESKDQLHSLR